MSNAIATQITVPGALQRAGLKALLQGNGFDVIAETSTVTEALDQRATGQADAPPALMLVECPGHDTPEFEALVTIKEHITGTRVVVLVDSLPPHAVQTLVNAGIDGVLKADIAPEALVGYVNLVLLGEVVIHRSVSLAPVVTRSRPSITAAAARLSEREIDVIQHVANGQSNKEIAQMFGIMDGTVKIHVRNVQRKLQLKNRTQIAVWAVENGMQLPLAA